MLKDLLGDTLQGMLEAELDESLGYSKYDYKNKETENSRNGYTHLHDVYGVDASAEMISHMTDRILPIAKEWQNRPLEKKYAVVFMDAVHFHVREDNRTIKKAVYVAIGTRLDGTKEVMGMWIGGNSHP